MQKFSLSQILSDASRSEGAESRTFAVRHIAIGQIMPSAGNWYSVAEEDIKVLADSIETLGLQHNIVVQNADEDGVYRIISGERRYRAMKMLFEQGNESYAAIPCKVDMEQGDAITRLKLLHANSTARVLTDAEKVRQAAELREVLGNLKAEGYPIKGRLRDIVAEELKVSAAQVGRMESIEKNLIPELKEAFNAGTVGMVKAYDLSTKPEEEQRDAILTAKEKAPAKKPKEPEKKAAPVENWRVEVLCAAALANHSPLKHLVDGEQMTTQEALIKMAEELGYQK